MFENVLNGSIFGKIEPGKCRLTANGQIAIKTSNGYKSYNLAKKKLVNQSNFVFDIGDDFFFVIPTNKAKPGDIILVNGKPRCVVTASVDRLEVVNYEDSTLDTVLPERHVFMGNTYFYGKIVSLLGSNFGKKGGTNKLMKMALQMQMMQSMMGGKSAGISNMFGGASNDGGNNMMQTMMMMSMFGNGGFGFGDMFENMFDFDDDDDTGVISDLMKADEEDDNEDNDKEEK